MWGIDNINVGSLPNDMDEQLQMGKLPHVRPGFCPKDCLLCHAVESFEASACQKTAISDYLATWQHE